MTEVQRRSHQRSGKPSMRADGEQRRISGYAAIFYDGTPDTEYTALGFRERIMPGAFDAAIGRPDDCRALVNHDSGCLLGRMSAKTLALSVDTTGLRYDIIPPDTAVARDVIALLERGDISGSSFAFASDDYDMFVERGEWIVEIRSVTLYDVGPVTFPAYEATTAELRSESALAEYQRRRAEIEAEHVARAERIRSLQMTL